MRGVHAAGGGDHRRSLGQGVAQGVRRGEAGGGDTRCVLKHRRVFGWSALADLLGSRYVPGLALLASTSPQQNAGEHSPRRTRGMARSSRTECERFEAMVKQCQEKTPSGHRALLQLTERTWIESWPGSGAAPQCSQAASSPKPRPAPAPSTIGPLTGAVNRTVTQVRG